jgi:sulfatase maturation enzyme AslB (radical SAM superfamily)
MLKKITNKIEDKRYSNSFFWQSLILIKDIVWRITTFPTYLKKNKILAWKTEKNKIEIELTSFCNLNCINCNRSVRQAPTKEYMTLEQVEKFVKESLNLKWRWKNIRITGGEPTLHPQLFKVLEAIKKYKEFYPQSKITIVTNGYGEKVKTVLKKLPFWLKIENSHKDSPRQKFISFNIAPIDLKKFKKDFFLKACEVTENCGLGLTRYGYYICATGGAGLDRVFGFDTGIKKLSELTDSSLKKQRRILCRYCGYYKIKDSNEKKNWINKEKMSPTWIKVYEKYKKQRPKLTLY